MVDIHRPQGVLGEREYICDELQQSLFVVENSAGEEAFASLVDHHAVVVFLADVHSGPDLGHVPSASSSSHTDPQTTSPTLSYTAIESRIPMSGRVVAGLRAAKFFEPSNGDK